MELWLTDAFMHAAKPGPTSPPTQAPAAESASNGTALSFPTPAEIIATIPDEGIMLMELMRPFKSRLVSEADRRRFVQLTKNIVVLDKVTKLVTRKK
jgi:hypothetical protein